MSFYGIEKYRKFWIPFFTCRIYWLGILAGGVLVSTKTGKFDIESFIYHYSLFFKFLETVSIRLFIVLLIIKSKETGNARSHQISRMKTKREIIILKFFLMWRLQCQDIVGKVQVDIFSSGLLTASCTLPYKLLLIWYNQTSFTCSHINNQLPLD